jgi:hypothetical protein
MDYVSPEDLIAYVTRRGYRANPMLNTIAAGAGQPLAVTGYLLIGPRGNRHALVKTREGLLPLDDAKLWCDGVDYATAAIRRKREDARAVPGMRR